MLLVGVDRDRNWKRKVKVKVDSCLQFYILTRTKRKEERRVEGSKQERRSDEKR